MDNQIHDIILTILLFPAAYLIGSVPTAVWIGKAFHGVDVRDHGSGNAGATNVMRVLGVKTGIPVLILDMLKGWVAVSLVHLQPIYSSGEEAFMLFAIFLGASAVLGHIFPILAGFRGGKGVATIAGVCLGLHPLGTISALGVFIIVFILWKYVSLGSITAGISFPLWLILVYNTPYDSLAIFAILAAIVLILTHRKNIGRLLRREENKATFLYRKKN